MTTNKKKIDELLSAKFNGTITPDQEAELEKLLNSDQQAKQRYAELQEKEPPTRPAYGNRPAAEETRPAAGRAYHSFLLRYAAMLMLGLLLGSGLTWLWLSEDIDDTQLRGSMIGTSESGLYFERANTSIRLVPYVIDDMYYLNFFSESSEETVAEIMFSDQDYVPVKSGFLTQGGSQATDMEMGAVSFTSAGKTAYQVILKKESNLSSPVMVKIYQQHSLLTSKQFFAD
ncbi:MAG: anti-sigma factor family protein [Bacteroidales bacterium]